MIADKISDFFNATGQSLKSIVKLALQSRRPSVSHADRRGCPLIILGNGPSLARNIAEDMELLTGCDTLAVNFAANTDEFMGIRPRYYLLMDPHFFSLPSSDPNVTRLYTRLDSEVDWEMTLFIPTGRKPSALGINNHLIHIEQFNPVGVEGYDWLVKKACDSGRGLPRPRNVLIPAIMTGIWLGYKEIYLLGADHSWLRTLDVDEEHCGEHTAPLLLRRRRGTPTRGDNVSRHTPSRIAVGISSRLQGLPRHPAICLDRRSQHL